MSDKTFLVEVSARHVHLCKADVETLFGAGHVLTRSRDLSQPGEFLCEERVDVIGPKKAILGMAILGPARAATQVEVALTDCFTLGSVGPVRESGDVTGSAGIILKGPNGEVELKEGLIVAKRHIHMNPEAAAEMGVKNKDIVKVAVDTTRPVIFCDVVVRVSEKFNLSMHVDTDEANASCIGKNGCQGRIVK